MKGFICTIGILGGYALAAWLGGYVMLYRGIAEAIACPNAGSIIKALLCGVGFIPGLFISAVAKATWAAWDD